MNTIDTELLETISLFECGLLSENELSDWFVNLVEKGIETESIVLLAGLLPSQKSEAPDLLRKAVTELGYVWPSEKQLGLTQAKLIAQQIINGKIQANKGCKKISSIYQSLDWPDELIGFGHLDHLQTGHEDLGYTPENLISEIIEEARKLVKIQFTLNC